MSRTSEEQREYNRNRKYAYRQRQKQVAAVGAVTGASPDLAESVEGAPVEVEVKNVVVEPHKPSLRERLGLGAKKAESAPAKRTSGRSSKAPNLVVTVLPTIIASIIIAFARDRLPEEYQPCAPTREEALAIINPLMDSLSQYITVAARVSRNTLNLINALIASMAYGTRAYITYVDIKKGKAHVLPQSDGRADSRAATAINQEPASYQAGLRAYQAAPDGTDITSAGFNGAGPGIGVNEPASNGADHPLDDSEIRDWEAKQAASLLRRDSWGRAAKGLV